MQELNNQLLQSSIVIITLKIKTNTQHLATSYYRIISIDFDSNYL